MSVYYNDNEPFVAQWLRNLIAAGHLPAGDVDERSIKEVAPEDLRGYTQCHFFAGIGGWPLALKWAGWPDEREVWTGSCPCQPFSQAGKGGGFDDPRHLWPDWFRLIRECRPATIFGEQVAAAIRHGWLDLVFDDLEGLDYSCGASDLPAASVGAPHARQRLFFVGRYSRPYSNSGNEYRRNCPMQMGWQRNQSTSSQIPFTNRDQWSIEPKPPTVVDGISNRMEKCCAYGNAIVPQVAAEFIKAVMDCPPTA